MTVSTTSRAQTYPDISGSTGPFDFSFSVESGADLRVIRYDSELDPTILSLTTDYTVTLTGGGASGGVVTLLVAGSSGDSLSIEGNTPLAQPTSFINQGAFQASSHEAALDRLTRAVQEISSRQSRSLSYPAMDEGEGLTVTLPPASARAGKAVVFDASGNVSVSESDYETSAGAAASSAAAAEVSRLAAAASAAAAEVSRLAAASSAASLYGTSVTSATIGTGSKSFTTQEGKQFTAGLWVFIAYDGSNYMHGQVTAYSGTSVTVDVSTIGGAGTHAAWVIMISGPPGPAGDAAALVSSEVSYDNSTSGLTATDVQAALDEIAAGAANYVVSSQTALSDLAADDVIGVGDTSDTGANKKVTVPNLFKALAVLTEDTTPALDDSLATYDLSATGAKRATVLSLLKALNLLTEDTTPDANNDFLLSYDASSGTVKKVKPVNIAGGWVTISDTSLSGLSTKTVSWSSGAYKAIRLEVLSGRGDTALRLNGSSSSIYLQRTDGDPYITASRVEFNEGSHYVIDLLNPAADDLHKFGTILSDYLIRTDFCFQSNTTLTSLTVYAGGAFSAGAFLRVLGQP